MKEIVNDRPVNYVIAALLIIVVWFTGYHEGYFPVLKFAFTALLCFGCVCGIWLARFASTKRMMGLILGIFIIEYIKETIGIKSGFWTYHGANGAYNFGVWAWVLAGVTVYTVSARLIVKTVRLLQPSMPKWLNPAPRYLNPLVIVCAFWFMYLGLWKYWDGVGIEFVVFYGILFLVSLYISYNIKFTVFVGFIIGTVLAGNVSEYLGAVGCGVWTFNHNPNYPPLFLVLGCWPLEILTQVGLAALVAREPFDLDCN
jgi:hypothetical protein